MMREPLSLVRHAHKLSKGIGKVLTFAFGTHQADRSSRRLTLTRVQSAGGKYGPSAAIEDGAMYVRNAAAPVFPGRSANSRCEADSGHPGARKISTSKTGLKVVQTWPVAAHGDEIARAPTQAQPATSGVRRLIECQLPRKSKWWCGP